MGKDTLSRAVMDLVQFIVIGVAAWLVVQVVWGRTGEWWRMVDEALKAALFLN